MSEIEAVYKAIQTVQNQNTNYRSALVKDTPIGPGGVINVMGAILAIHLLISVSFLIYSMTSDKESTLKIFSGISLVILLCAILIGGLSTVK